MKIAFITDVHLDHRNPPVRKDDFLQEALNKIKFIADSNDICVFLGDLVHIKNNSDYFFNRLYSFFSSYSKGKFHTILGNHDIHYRNKENLSKVTIGNLFDTGVLQIHKKDFELGGVYIGVSSVEKDMSKLKVNNDNKGILIGHNYFEDSKCPEESFTAEEIRKLNYKYVILGHEHKPHDDLYFTTESGGDCILYRIGSLTRIDRQQYNINRDVFYLQYDTETEELEKIKVPCKSDEECFSPNAFIMKKERDSINYDKIAEELEKLKGGSREGDISLDLTLKKIGCPAHLIKNIKLKHDLNGLQYT